MTRLIFALLYALGVTIYFRYYSDTDQPFESMVAVWIATAIGFFLLELLSFSVNLTSFYLWKREQDAFEPSPTDQDCTPDGGVSANRTDDNSTGGVTTPGVTWRASGSHSHGGAHE